MISFRDFIHEYKLKYKTTSVKKIYQVRSSFGLNNVGIFSRDGLFESIIKIVILHHSKGTLWVTYIRENFFDSSACAPPEKLSKFIIKQNGHCLYSE